MSFATKSRPNADGGIDRSSRGRVITPIFPQFKITECGAACLGIVLAYHGRWVPMEELRNVCGISRDGSNAADLVRAAHRYDIHATGWSKDIDELRTVPLPAILFWKFNHFVVLEGFGRGRYYLNDPANGRRTVSEETFSQEYTGVVLLMEPATDFQPGGTPPGIARRLWPWLKDVKRSLTFAAVCGLLLALPGVALPLLLNVFVDYFLSGEEPTWGGLLVAAAALLAVVVYLLTWLQQHCLHRLAVRLSVVHGERFLSRLFRLPIGFFTHRYAGDLTSRAQSVDWVANGAARQFVNVMIRLVMSLVFLAVMIVYDPPLAALVAVLGVANAYLMRTVTRLRSDENRQMRREQALLSGVGSFGLRSIDSLRASGREDDFFVRWTGYQARELAVRQRFVEMGHVIASFPGMFMILGSAVVLGMGGWRVISGEMTIGMLMGFYVIAGNFLQPIGLFVLFVDAFQVLEADLYQINDVINTAEDPALAAQKGTAPGRVPTLGGRLRLAGRLELRNVTFGYKPHYPPLLKDFSLTINPGQRVAVIGPTGSGKSTLLKLVSGQYTPWSGEILFDGVSSKKIPREVLTRSVATVDQENFLFAAPVRDNLTLWNPTAPEHLLVAAARDAQIHQEIMSRPTGYDSQVEEGGRNFSGGQRQRLEISRALVNNPSVLLLDEATSTLDAVTEMRIDDALRRRGCTSLIVAHRLSTIRDCDEIIVLDLGQEVQRGTHDQLIADEQGLYYQLVQAQ